MIHHDSDPATTRGPLVLAQAMMTEKVLAAGWFATNVAGRRELSLQGFRERQQLKGRRAYVSERMLLAVTELHAVALRPWGLIVGPTELARWLRSSLLVHFTISRSHPDGAPTAIEIFDRRVGHVVADVEPCRDRISAFEVIEMLARSGSPSVLH